jgi:hypothetical protein
MVHLAEVVLNPGTSDMTTYGAFADSNAPVLSALRDSRCHPGVSRPQRGWRLPERWQSILHRRDVQVTLAMVSVVIMLTTSLPASTLISNPSQKKADNVILATNQPPYYPYLTSARTFPVPDNLTNPMGPAYYPQLAVSSIANVTIYDLVYSVNVSGVGSVVELATGT